MAEPKRHMDVPKERVLERHPHTNPPAKFKQKRARMFVPVGFDDQI